MSARKKTKQAAPTTDAEKALASFNEEGKLTGLPDLALVRRLWPFLAPYRAWLGLSGALVLLGAAGSLTRPLLMRYTIDAGVSTGDMSRIALGGSLFAGVIVAEQVFAFVEMYAVQVVGARSMAALRGHVFRHLHSIRLGWFDRQPIGRMVSRVTNDVDAIQELFAFGILGVMGDILKLVGIVVLMLLLDWQLSLIAFAAVPPVAVMVLVVRRRMRDAYRAIRSKTAQINAQLGEQVTGLPVVQAYTREEAAAREFDQVNGEYRDANIANIKYEAMQDAAIEMATAICLASVIVSLGFRPSSFGTVVAFNAYIVQFFDPFTQLAQRYSLLQSALSGAERVFQLLDTKEPDAPPIAGVSAEPKDDAALELEHVHFEYRPGVPVLRDVQLRVARGEKIALVGPTGAGKTTVSALLLRLYDVEDGIVRVDGIDVRALPRDDLRRRFAVVPQDVFLFPGTIASNVAASPEPDLARVQQALRQIDALELFEKREGGLLAKVGENGGNFSSGERQLLAFARAIYRDAPILILDEATASVDSDTEARLQRALEAALEGRTAIIIAHRLSTIRRADRIVVFQRGRVVEQGPHDDLLAAGGLYSKLHDLQFARQHAAE